MGRIKENEKLVKSIIDMCNEKSIVDANTKMPQIMSSHYLFAMTIYLEDISKSLAVIADSLQKNNNASKENENENQ